MLTPSKLNEFNHAGEPARRLLERTERKIGGKLMENHLHCDSPEQLGNSGEPALVSGRLMEVNWANGTAELHRFMDRIVPLRFAPNLTDDVRRCGAKYVQVKGRGWFTEDDAWKVVEVEQIDIPRMRTADEILNDPNPKIFRVENMPPPIKMTDEESEAFDRAIREGRWV